MKSLTVYFFVSTAIDSVNVVISRDRFEHELTWLAFKNINSRADPFGKRSASLYSLFARDVGIN